MTPERKAYLEKCSEREKLLREDIRFIKWRIKSQKKDLGAIKRKHPHLWKKYAEVTLRWIKENKYRLSAYRHELERLKLMDLKVVVIKQPIAFTLEDLREGRILPGGI